jgi:hypothetical protein
MKTTTCLFFLLAAFVSTDIYAQQGVTASGVEAFGVGGNASISTGQVFYTEISSQRGTVTQGVQQPFEIYVLGKDNFKSISLNATIYPNPTVSNISLRIESDDLTGMKYELYDLNGRTLCKDFITEKETVVNMEKYPGAIYILKVYSGSSELKSFKIIKNSI